MYGWFLLSETSFLRGRLHIGTAALKKAVTHPHLDHYCLIGPEVSLN